MDVFIFNLQRYIIIFLFYFIGSQKAFKSINSDKQYFKALLLPIFLYSFFEGTRWMRGADYEYNYNIANGIQTSNDIAYDSLAQILNYIGFPYWVFFILISFLLIYSLTFLCKEFKSAFVPCIILLYAFTMNQSENLMRQYTAISCMLLSFTLYFEEKYKWSIIWIVIAYLCHSSVIFILPFFLLFRLIICKDNLRNKILKYLPVVFLLLYLSSSILKIYFYDVLQNITITNSLFATKYLSEEYYLKATDDTLAVAVENSSFLDTIRSYWKSIVVILSSYFIFKKGIFNNKNIMLFVIYSISCCGYIYEASLPNLTMEVIGRLGLYLYIFSWFFEGYVIYYFLNKNNIIDTRCKVMRFLVVCLIIMESVWILKPQTAGTHGYLFIWS